jgi:histone-binding protein RBBP4
VWDVAQIGGTIATSDNEDGPSELIFTHGGHTSLINDVDWNVNEDLMCASVSEDNVVQIWEMNNDIYYNDK